MPPQVEIPWAESDAGRALGAVELVCEPRLGLRAAASLGLTCLGCGTGLGTFLALSWFMVAYPDLALLACGVFPLAWAVILGSVGQPLDEVSGTRLVLGQHGIALWRPHDILFVRWDDLGALWHIVPGDRRAGTLVLVRTDGTEFRISHFYEHSDTVTARVLAEFSRRHGLAPWAEQPMRPAAATITSAERNVIEPK
jgi:hypothetical protein